MVGDFSPVRHGYKQSVALPYNVRQRDHLLYGIISHIKTKVNRKAMPTADCSIVLKYMVLKHTNRNKK